MKELVSMYAKAGKISDSYAAYSCRLNPNIDKELYKLTEINILDCNEIKRKYEKYACNENYQDSLMTSEDGVYFICDGGKWFYASQYEIKFGICNPKKFGKIETYDENEKIICDSTEHNWRKATTREVDLYQQSCDADEPGKIVKPCGEEDCEGLSYVCENGSWRKATATENLIGVCTSAMEGEYAAYSRDGSGGIVWSYYQCTNLTWRGVSRSTYLYNKPGTCNSTTKKDTLTLSGVKYYCYNNVDGNGYSWQKI
jgi:hypothetical protein